MYTVETVCTGQYVDMQTYLYVSVRIFTALHCQVLCSHSVCTDCLTDQQSRVHTSAWTALLHLYCISQLEPALVGVGPVVASASEDHEAVTRRSLVAP